MFVKLIFKNLLQRPGRFILTGLAIVLGVLSVVAVFTFTDGLRDTFSTLSDDIECCYDVEVSASSAFGDNFLAPPLPVELADEILELPEVEVVQPRILGPSTIAIDGDGERIVSSGGPNFGVNWEQRSVEQRSFIVDGVAPLDMGEFVVDADLFTAGNFELGGTYEIESQLSGVQEFELVGTFNFGSQDVNRTVGAQLIAFSEDQALEFLNAGEGFDTITATGVDTGDDEGLAALIEEELDAEGNGFKVETQEQRASVTGDAFGTIVSIFQYTLLAFAGIIFFVAAFLIFNVFNITLGQRVKELSLLRSIGSTGNQVTRMVLWEALVLGIIATALGTGLGYLASFGLRAALTGVGFPNDVELALSPLTIVLAFVLGIGVTMAAATFPSLKARQITPIDGLSDIPTDESKVVSKIPQGLGLVAGAIAVTIYSFFVTDFWLIKLVGPLLAAAMLYQGLNWLTARNRVVVGFTTLAFGLGLLTYARFADLGLAEAFSLIGAGALVTVLSMSQIGGVIGSPIAKLLGGIPSAVVMFIVGALLALASVGSLVGGIAGMGDNGAGALIGGIIGALLLGLFAYLVLRTALASFGITGRLGKQNAARNPQRTSTTAAALMIGVALITTVSVIGTSIKESVNELLGTSIQSEVFVQPSSATGEIPNLPKSVAQNLRSLDGVDSVWGYKYTFAGVARVSGTDVSVEMIEDLRPEILAALNPNGGVTDAEFREFELANEIDVAVEDAFVADIEAFESHVDLDFIEYSDEIISGTDDPIFLEEDFAEDNGYVVGSSYFVVFPFNEEVAEFTVAGLFTNDFLTTSPRVFITESWEASFEGRPRNAEVDNYLSIKVSEDFDATLAMVEERVDEETLESFTDRYETPTDQELRTELVRADVADVLAEQAPSVTALTNDESAESASEQIDTILQTINVLLILAIFIALLSVAISLSLSVFERTREIGLMRAVGTTRPQTRRSIRWEGAIVAVFGAVVGLVLGIGFGVLASQKLPESFVTLVAIPYGTIVALLIGSMVAGLISAVFPAWRAGRMNVLDAISHD